MSSGMVPLELSKDNNQYCKISVFMPNAGSINESVIGKLSNLLFKIPYTPGTIALFISDKICSLSMNGNSFKLFISSPRSRL